jgi:hypothetical protein
VRTHSIAESVASMKALISRSRIESKKPAAVQANVYGNSTQPVRVLCSSGISRVPRGCAFRVL